MSTRLQVPAAARLAVELAATIHEERRRRRWTLRELAARSGVSRSMIAALENGQVGSLETYARVGAAFGLRPEFAFIDSRKRSVSPRAEDPVHSAMVEAMSSHLRRVGSTVALDEPYQHYQFAGRADLLAWDVGERALLHVEARTRFPNVQEAVGSFNAKHAYLGGVMAQRLGIAGPWRWQTHVIVAVWSSEVLHALRLREMSFRAVCPDGPEPFAAWWKGSCHHGRTRGLVIFDPLAIGSGRRRSWVGMDDLRRIRPRFRDYTDALIQLKAAGLA